MKIKSSLLWTWRDQALADALKWIGTKVNKQDPKALEAYQAGFEQGYGALKGLMILHGYLAIDEKS